MEDLILLHGAIGAKIQLEQLQDLLKTRYKVHTLNFGGHGGSPDKNSFSINGFAMDVLDYIREHDISQAAVFGYSLGGYVALYLARHYPGYISSIITLATKFHWDARVAAKEIKLLDPQLIREKVPAFALQQEQYHGKENWEVLMSKTQKLLLELGEFNKLGTGDYNQISVPCLLLLGENDRMVTREETELVQQLMPAAAFSLLPDTAHPLEQVNMKMLAGILDGFYSGQKGS